MNRCGHGPAGTEAAESEWGGGIRLKRRPLHDHDIDMLLTRRRGKTRRKTLGGATPHIGIGYSRKKDPAFLLSDADASRINRLNLLWGCWF